jgi:hypothetical protein
VFNAPKWIRARIITFFRFLDKWQQRTLMHFSRIFGRPINPWPINPWPIVPNAITLATLLVGFFELYFRDRDGRVVSAAGLSPWEESAVLWLLSTADYSRGANSGNIRPGNIRRGKWRIISPGTNRRWCSEHHGRFFPGKKNPED